VKGRRHRSLFLIPRFNRLLSQSEPTAAWYRAPAPARKTFDWSADYSVYSNEA
jgi:hypothetical protein